MVSKLNDLCIPIPSAIKARAIFRPHHSGVAWSVSVCACWSCSWALRKWLNRSRCHLGEGMNPSGGSKELGIRWGPRCPKVKGQFWGKWRPIVKYRDTTVSCAKNAELIEIPFGMKTRVDSRNRVLDGGPDSSTGRGSFEEVSVPQGTIVVVREFVLIQCFIQDAWWWSLAADEEIAVVVCQLVEWIDGYRHVASIAQMANGDVDVIKSRVANLVWVNLYSFELAFVKWSVD